jgi:hypothetical protein
MGNPNVEQLVALTHTYEATGEIDKTDNLKDDRVYLYSGKSDTVVVPAVVQSLQTYYNFFMAASNVVGDFSIDSEHCFPTLAYGEVCGQLSSPYIGKCKYDGAEQIFRTLYGQNINDKGTAKAANLQSFSQTSYFSGRSTSIDDKGYIYVPTACASGSTCHLHVALHGCLQTQDDIGNDYAAQIGLNEWAETNNAIVLYPYVKKSLSAPSNPNGCWDWWGYTDKNYGTKRGIQMQFVRQLIKEVSGM